MKLIDFQGIISLDHALVDQLQQYLQEKESQVSKSIINAIHPLPRESLPPVLPYSTTVDLKLSDAIEAFSKNVHQVANSARPLVAINDWELATRQINNALWEYVEVLEGCVTELFQQLGQVGFEQWHPELMQVVDSIKNMLSIRMDELRWKIRQIESLLWEYRWACEAFDGRSIFLKKLIYFWKSLLDRALQGYLKKSQKYLKIRYQWFSSRYNDYIKLNVKVESSLKKFSGYRVFKDLEESVQSGFKKIYQLLKLWELNLRSSSLPAREPIRVLRSAYSIDKAASIFNDYYASLRNALFERSRKFKRDSNELYMDASSRRIINEIIKGYRAEVHTLGVTIGKYRDFFLRTHPNPYIRTRWGFAEWIVGPEPSQTKELLNHVYEVELLDKLFEDLENALKKGSAAYDSLSLTKQYREILDTLHEMGQPLTTRSVMRARAEKFLGQIQLMDELGSFNPEVIDYVGKSFSKALRADWQYHVLFEISLFHQLYKIHQGILGPIVDRNHLNRMNKFKELIAQIEGWVRNRDTHRHMHEIETDMMDMKGYLQDFYAYIQRISLEKDISKTELKEEVVEAAKQLLEYRYLFGKFFHNLHQHEPEGKLIRNQFLFIDQYFESVENKLHELRREWKKNS